MRQVKFFLFIAITLISFGLRAQQYEFPKDWLGTWSGELEIFSGLKKVNSIPMTLEISEQESTDRLKYFITYADDLRAYYLHAVDSAKGHYLLDEKNGIQIDTYLIGDQLISTFEVMGSLIHTRSYRTGSALQYEIVAGRIEPVSISGDTIMGQDTIPPVQAFPFTVSQLATLTRVENSD